MQNVPLAIVHVTAQTVAGVAIGSVADAIFPVPCPVKSTDTMGFLLLSAEVSAQMVFTGLLSSSFVSMTSSPTYGDPTGGVAFMMALADSQPNLHMKLKNLCGVVASVLRRTAGAMPGDLPRAGELLQSKAQASISNPYMQG